MDCFLVLSAVVPQNLRRVVALGLLPVLLMAPVAAVAASPTPVSAWRLGGYGPARLLAQTCELPLPRAFLLLKSRANAALAFALCCNTAQVKAFLRKCLASKNERLRLLAVSGLSASGRLSDARAILGLMSISAVGRGGGRSGESAISAILGTPDLALGGGANQDVAYQRKRLIAIARKLMGGKNPKTYVAYWAQLVEAENRRWATIENSDKAPPFGPGGLIRAWYSLLAADRHPAAVIRTVLTLLPESGAAFARHPRLGRYIEADVLWRLQWQTGPILPFPLDISGDHADDNMAALRRWWQNHAGKPPVTWMLESLAKAGFSTGSPGNARLTFQALMRAAQSKRVGGLCSYTAARILNKAFPGLPPVLVQLPSFGKGKQQHSIKLWCLIQGMESYSLAQASLWYLQHSPTLVWRPRLGLYRLVAKKIGKHGRRSVVKQMGQPAWPPGGIPESSK